MTTSSPHAPLPDETPVRPSTHWIPLDGLTQRWATLSTRATTPQGLVAAAMALTAVAQERSALRHLTLAAQARTPTHHSPPMLSDWSEGYRERECCLEALHEAVRSWHEAARALDRHTEQVPRDQHEEHLALFALIGGALVQRARIGHLIAEVLGAQATCYEQQAHPHVWQ